MIQNKWLWIKTILSWVSEFPFLSSSVQYMGIAIPLNATVKVKIFAFDLARRQFVRYIAKHHWPPDTKNKVSNHIKIY